MVKSAVLELVSGWLVLSTRLQDGGTQISASSKASVSLAGLGDAGAAPGADSAGVDSFTAAVTLGTKTSREPDSSRRLCFSEVNRELPSGPLPTANFTSPMPMTWPGITNRGGLLRGGSRMTVCAAASMLLMGLPVPGCERLRPTASLRGGLS